MPTNAKLLRDYGMEELDLLLNQNITPRYQKEHSNTKHPWSVNTFLLTSFFRLIIIPHSTCDIFSNSYWLNFPVTFYTTILFYWPFTLLGKWQILPLLIMSWFLLLPLSHKYFLKNENKSFESVYYFALTPYNCREVKSLSSIFANS